MRMIKSLAPLIRCLLRRKNSRRYRFILLRKVAGPISFFATIPNRWYPFSFSLRKKIKFFEANRFPFFITPLKSRGRAILSFRVSLNNPFTGRSAFSFPWLSFVSKHSARSGYSFFLKNRGFSFFWHYSADKFFSLNPSFQKCLVFWND